MLERQARGLLLYGCLPILILVMPRLLQTLPSLRRRLQNGNDRELCCNILQPTAGFPLWNELLATGNGLQQHWRPSALSMSGRRTIRNLDGQPASLSEAQGPTQITSHQ